MWGEWGGLEHVATMSNLNPNYLKLLLVDLSQVELGLGFDNFVRFIFGHPLGMVVSLWTYNQTFAVFFNPSIMQN